MSDYRRMKERIQKDPDGIVAEFIEQVKEDEGHEEGEPLNLLKWGRRIPWRRLQSCAFVTARPRRSDLRESAGRSSRPIMAAAAKGAKRWPGHCLNALRGGSRKPMRRSGTREKSGCIWLLRSQMTNTLSPRIGIS